MARRKTAREKLEREHPSHGKAFPIPPEAHARLGKGMMIVPRPLDVDAVMRSVRKGKLITQSQLRARLARAAGVQLCCPLTTGIFARLAAEAAEEDAAAGKARITPWWRTIKDDGRLNDKFPGGEPGHAKRLRAEGFKIAAPSGRRPRVVDFEACLVPP